MAWVNELRPLRDYILRFVAVVVFFSVFFFTFGIKGFTLFGVTVFLPSLAEKTFAVEFFDALVSHLLPQSVSLIVVEPTDAFASEVRISVLLSLIVSFPYLIYLLGRYVAPALNGREKQAVAKLFLFSGMLFLLGTFFAYSFILPPVFKFLYGYAANIEAEELVVVSKFVSFVFSVVFIVGFSFLLPVIMYMLSRLNVLSKDFFKTRWQYAFLGFLILSAVVTPDGSGISMAILTLPLMALYGLGIIVSKK